MKQLWRACRKWFPHLFCAVWKKMYLRIFRKSWRKSVMSNSKMLSKSCMTHRLYIWKKKSPSRTRVNLIKINCGSLLSLQNWDRSAVHLLFALKIIGEKLPSWKAACSWSRVPWTAVIVCFCFPSLPLCWPFFRISWKKREFLIILLPGKRPSKSVRSW